MANNLLNTRQAAAYIGMSKAFLERDRWAGARIPFVRVGSRAVRYRREDLERFIAGQVRASTSDDGGRRLASG
jgi:predicted DNA-binding transcriptional regulator AlpA